MLGTIECPVMKLWGQEPPTAPWDWDHIPPTHDLHQETAALAWVEWEERPLDPDEEFEF